MNKIYRVIWNSTLNVFQVCSELASGKRKSSSVDQRQQPKYSGNLNPVGRFTLSPKACLSFFVMMAISGSAFSQMNIVDGQTVNINDRETDTYLTVGGSNRTGNSAILNILPGGTLTLTGDTDSRIGVYTGAPDAVNVRGSGVLTLTNAKLRIGISSEGSLNVLNGGTVNAKDVYVGSSTGTAGTITVSGNNSTLATQIFNVGYSGQGTMKVTDYGKVTTNASATIASLNGGNSLVEVSSGGRWDILNSSSLTVGSQGNAALMISSGGQVSAGRTTLGNYEGSAAVVKVDGNNSRLDATSLMVGDGGNSSLDITNGAVVSSIGQVSVARLEETEGTINVNSGGQLNIVNGEDIGQWLRVGQTGSGMLNIASGGKVKAGDVDIGSSTTSVGKTDVTGSGSTLSTSALNVGYQGNGTLTINSAGRVTAGAIILGSRATADGQIVVDGGGSLLQGNNMVIGDLGSGAVTLSNAGTLALDTAGLVIAGREGGSGTLNIGAAHGASAAVAGKITGTGTGSVTFGAGNGSLVFNHTDDSATGYGFNQLISGENGAVMQDAGHTVFTAENSYGGRTEVNGGTLTVASLSSTGNSGLGSSAVNIAEAGTLSITGSSQASGDYALNNALTGDGLLQVDLASADNAFSFTDATGTAFTGTAELKNSIFDLSGDNTLTLAQATLKLDAGNTTTVGDGVQ
ncbi:ESPR-type extended signal peptide-containing protein, partial [Pseudocitrobacter sp. MW920760]|nr:ESPR-type extended signal peptide-containing protein [Pseudocitrobacter sp. MW920760]